MSRGSRTSCSATQWMLAFANTLQPAYRLWFYPNEGAGEANADATKEKCRERIEKFWDRFDAHLAANGPHVLGKRFSAADLYATMLMRWSRNMPKTALAWPHVKALADRVRSRASWKTLYEREGLTEWV